MAARIEEAATALVAARSSGTPVAPPADGWGLASDADGFAVQRRTMATIGPVGGWKILLAQPTANGAPFPEALVVPSGSAIQLVPIAATAVELEIAVTLREIPAQGHYDRQSVASVMQLHPALEIVQSRLEGPSFPLSALADCMSAGALILGQGRPLAEFDFDAAQYTLAVGAAESSSDGKGRPGPDAIVDGIVWLLNHQDELGAVAAGQPILTGARVKLDAPSRGAKIWGSIMGLGAVDCTLA